MSQTTKADVREKVEHLSDRTGVDYEISHTAQGYYLVEADTHNRVGPICQTSGEFMLFLRGFDYGVSHGRRPDGLSEWAESRDDTGVEVY